MEIDDPDRARGILGKVDRRFLIDPEEYGDSRQARYKRRQEIPKRIRNAFLDLSIIASPEFNEEFLDEAFRQTLPKTSPKTVLAEEKPAYVVEHDEPWKEGTYDVLPLDEDIWQGFVDAIALTGRSLSLSDYTALVEEATETVVRRYHPNKVVVNAGYDPEIDDPDHAHDRAKWKLSEGQELTDGEVRVLLERGEVDAETVAEHVRPE